MVEGDNFKEETDHSLSGAELSLRGWYNLE
jgi:hypothetical protein